MPHGSLAAGPCRYIVPACGSSPRYRGRPAGRSSADPLTYRRLSCCGIRAVPCWAPPWASLWASPWASAGCTSTWALPWILPWATLWASPFWQAPISAIGLAMGLNMGFFVHGNLALEKAPPSRNISSAYTMRSWQFGGLPGGPAPRQSCGSWFPCRGPRCRRVPASPRVPGHSW